MEHGPGPTTRGLLRDDPSSPCRPLSRLSLPLQPPRSPGTAASARRRRLPRATRPLICAPRTTAPPTAARLSRERARVRPLCLFHPRPSRQARPRGPMYKTHPKHLLKATARHTRATPRPRAAPHALRPATGRFLPSVILTPRAPRLPAARPRRGRAARPGASLQDSSASTIGRPPQRQISAPLCRQPAHLRPVRAVDTRHPCPSHCPNA